MLIFGLCFELYISKKIWKSLYDIFSMATGLPNSVECILLEYIHGLPDISVYENIQ